MLKELDSGKEYILPKSSKKYDNKRLKMFLLNCNSAYGAAKILFGGEKYYDSLMDNPKATAKFANIFITNSNVDIPKDDVEELYNTLFLKYFPIEWIVENIIINEDNVIFCYDEKSNKYYLDKFVDKNYKYITPLSKNMTVIQHAVKNDRLKELYDLYA